jgi:S-methylmethionine-dependent homocysteine/selenocysteine methylase
MEPITILDGGMGKELHRIGAPFGQPEWSALALMEAPEFVAEAHKNFVEAGAAVIITNTYACVPFHLGQDRYVDSAEDLVALAARTARGVADKAERPVLVAGSLPPLFGSYQPELFDPDLAPAMYHMMVKTQEQYVDLWIGETISKIAEFEAIAAAVEQSSKPLWASFCAADEAKGDIAEILSGESVAEVAEVAEPRCTAILFNCSRPESVGPAIEDLVAALGRTEVRVGGYANAFVHDAGDDYSANSVVLTRRDDMTARAYGDIAEQWIESGATIVGGCCGIHPEHIAELSRRFGSDR